MGWNHQPENFTYGDSMVIRSDLTTDLTHRGTELLATNPREGRRRWTLEATLGPWSSSAPRWDPRWSRNILDTYRDYTRLLYRYTCFAYDIYIYMILCMIHIPMCICISIYIYTHTYCNMCSFYICGLPFPGKRRSEWGLDLWRYAPWPIDTFTVYGLYKSSLTIWFIYDWYMHSDWYMYVILW